MSDIFLQGHALALSFVEELYGQPTHINMARAQLHLTHCLEYGRRFKLGKLIVLNLPDISVAFHDVQDRLIHQGAPVDVAFDVLLPGQCAHLRDHCLSQSLPFFPI